MDQCTNISGFAALPVLERAAREPVPETLPELADDVLVAAVREGDEGAFEMLFERHRRAVTRLAYRFFYRREQVEDIVQESFASAYFALSTYRGGQERSFIAWLTRITVRTCYDALRRAKRTESSLSELTVEETELVSNKLRGAGQLVAHQLGLLYGQLAQRTLSPFRPPQCIVASSNSYSRQPRDERSLLPASISAQREISARETLLNDVFDLLATIEESISETRYCASMTLKQHFKSTFVSFSHGSYENVICQLRKCLGDRLARRALQHRERSKT